MSSRSSHKDSARARSTTSAAEGTVGKRTVVLLIGLAVVIVGFAFRHELFPARRDLLFLNDDVALTPAPPLPPDDLGFMRDRLRKLSMLRAASAQRGNDFNSQLTIGTAALQLGDALNAVGPLSRAIRLSHHPTPDILVNFSRAQAMLGQCDLAMQTTDQLIRMYPTTAVGYIEKSLTLDLLNRAQEGAGVLASGFDALPQDDVTGRLALIRQTDSDGDTGRAVAEAQKLHHSAPASREAALTLVELLIKTRRVDDAYLIASQIVKAEPGNADAHFDLGIVLSSVGSKHHDDALAEDELLTAARSAPTNQAYCSKLAEVYQNRGRFKQCAYMALQVLALQSDSASARLQLSQSLSHLGKSAEAAEQASIAKRLLERDAATAELQTRLFTHANSRDANIDLGRHFEKWGQYKNALSRFESAVVIDPSNQTARNELYSICKKLELAAPPREQIAQLHAAITETDKLAPHAVGVK